VTKITECPKDRELRWRNFQPSNYRRPNCTSSGRTLVTSLLQLPRSQVYQMDPTPTISGGLFY